MPILSLKTPVLLSMLLFLGLTSRDLNLHHPRLSLTQPVQLAQSHLTQSHALEATQAR